MQKCESPSENSVADRVEAGWEHDAGDGPRCLVVMYHYVRPDDPSVADGIHGLSPERFTAQLEQLTAAMEPTSWPDLYAGMTGRRPIPDRCFLLTFDDGLADHYRTVAPILQRWRLPGVFFVPGAVLATQEMLPAHAVHLLLATLGDEPFEQLFLAELAARGGPADPLAAIDSAAAERLYHYETPQRARLKYLLYAVLPIDLRNQIVASMFERHIGAGREWARRWYLGWKEVVELRSLGHTIGGHGFSHEPLARLEQSDLFTDVRRCAEVLHEGLGSDPRPISYPFGRVDDAVAGACRDAGFVQGFTTQRRWARPDDDIMRVPRVDTIHVDAAVNEEALCRHP